MSDYILAEGKRPQKEYTLYNKFGNTLRIELDAPPLIVQRGYILGKYDVEFVAETDMDAIRKMEAWLEANTPYRGFAMAAKNLGFYDLFIDDTGRRFLHGFYDGRGKFQFSHEGITGQF